MSDDSGDIISAQDNDDFIQDVKAFVKKGTLPCHTVGYRNKVERTGKDAFLDKGIVWVWMNRPTRSPYFVLLTPDALKKIVMDVAHAGFTGGHSGKNRTVDR